MSYLCDLFFIFTLIFILNNHIISLKQTNFLFAHFSEYLKLVYDDNMDEGSEQLFNSKSSALGCCLGFAWFFISFNLVLLLRALHVKKACISIRNYNRYCVKSVHICNFLWPIFSRIWNEFGDLIHKSPDSVGVLKNTNQKKLWLWRLFTQCNLSFWVNKVWQRVSSYSSQLLCHYFPSSNYNF